jgi:hypothetical protein
VWRGRPLVEAERASGDDVLLVQKSGTDVMIKKKYFRRKIWRKIAVFI